NARRHQTRNSEMTSRWPWTIVLLVLAGSIAPAQEQDSASHIRLTGSNGPPRPPADVAKQLMNHVSGRAQTNGAEPEKVKDMADKLLERIRDSRLRLDKPEDQRQFLEKNPDLKSLLSDIDTNNPAYQQRLQYWKSSVREPGRPNQGEKLP